MKREILNNDKAKVLRNNPTDTELFLWKYLQKSQIEGFKFRRQQPIGQYIVDFVCPKKKLIIELDGGGHAFQEEKDKRRDIWLKKEGFTVLRFWDNDVFNNIEGILESIRGHLISPTPSPPPLKGGEHCATS